jgi:hypothetical protein
MVRMHQVVNHDCSPCMQGWQCLRCRGFRSRSSAVDGTPQLQLHELHNYVMKTKPLVLLLARVVAHTGAI